MKTLKLTQSHSQQVHWDFKTGLPGLVPFLLDHTSSWLEKGLGTFRTHPSHSPLTHLRPPVTSAWLGKASQLSLAGYSLLTATMRGRDDTESHFLLQEKRTFSTFPILPLTSITPQWISPHSIFHEFTYTLLILPFCLQIFTSYFKKIFLPLSCMLPFSLGNSKKKILNMADQGRSSAKDTHVPKKRGLYVLRWKQIWRLVPQFSSSPFRIYMNIIHLPLSRL